MSEQLQRAESLQPLHELANSMAQEMGEQPEERLDWLMQQSGESFGNMLIQVNAAARGNNLEDHDFDGHNVQAGTIGGSIPPDQHDKVTLLDELMACTQKRITAQSEQGEDAQIIINELAVAIPTVVNKLHLFADGNGRTSRMLRMVLRDGDQITAERVNALVHKTSTEKYDTTPAIPVERSILNTMKSTNGAAEILVIDDVVDEDTFADEIDQDILSAFPTISRDVIKAYSDSANFNETVRLLGKDSGVTNTLSLRDVFGRVADNPGELAKFKAVYARVRKQRVELLISGLIGEQQIPITITDKLGEMSKWFNNTRVRAGQEPIDPSQINSIQDFQMAYAETSSPERTAA